MRLIKMLSLAAIAAVAAMAFVGAGTASANVKKVVLCKANQKLCTSANLWGSHVTIKALSPVALLLGTITVECHSEVTVLAELSHADRILGKITSLKWNNCKGCTTATTTALPTGSLFPAAGQNGTLLTTSLTTVLLEHCTFFNFHCTALATDASLAFLGGTIGAAGTAQAHAHEVPVVLHGAGCGGTGKWDAQDGLGVSKSYHVIEVNGVKTGEIWVSPESHL